MPQIYLQRNQLKYTKKQYRVRNWREYEAGLCKRGDLTIWFSEDALRDWHPPVGAKPDGPVHILIDSTGLQAHRGPTAPADTRNHRTWRKLHLVVDVTTAEILTSKITTHCTRSVNSYAYSGEVEHRFRWNVNSDSGIVNTDSGNCRKSVHLEPNGCSRCLSILTNFPGPQQSRFMERGSVPV